jgi:hypothetical protein
VNGLMNPEPMIATPADVDEALAIERESEGVLAAGTARRLEAFEKAAQLVDAEPAPTNARGYPASSPRTADERLTAILRVARFLLGED